MADVRHRGRGDRPARRRLAVAGEVERAAGLETHPGTRRRGLRLDAAALPGDGPLVRPRKQHPYRSAASSVRDRHADEAPRTRHPRRTPRFDGHLVPVHAAGGNEHAAGDGHRGVRRGRGSRIGHRRTADDAVGHPAAARRSRIGTFQPWKTRAGLLLPRPAAERAAGPLGGYVHPRRGGRRSDLHRPRVQSRRPGADYLGADAGAEPYPHGRIRRLGQTTGAPDSISPFRIRCY